MKIDKKIGLEHLYLRSKKGISLQLNLLTRGEGSRTGCLLSLSTSFCEKSLASYFIEKALVGMRQHSYAAAKLRCMYLHEKPSENLGWFGLLFSLLSDSPDIIHWFSQHSASLQGAYHKKLYRNQVNSNEYLNLQSLLALQGKFDLLGERAEYFLAHPPKNGHKRFKPDHEFYLGLAKGDTIQMEQAIATLCSPKVCNRRNFIEGEPIAEHLFSISSVYYSKIAWRHGNEVAVDSPYIPLDLLPIAPLKEYVDEYQFMTDFDIFKPLKGDFKQLSPTRIGQKSHDITYLAKPLEILA